MVGAVLGLIGFGILAVNPDSIGLVQSIAAQLPASVHFGDFLPTDLTRALGSPEVIMLLSLVACIGLWHGGPFSKRQLRPIAMTADWRDFIMVISR